MILKYRTLMGSWLVLAILSTGGFAQTRQSETNESTTKIEVPTATGPHGGSLKKTDSNQVEIVVASSGIEVFIYDPSGMPVSIDRGRGSASIRVDGNAKRYRYDLLPNGKGALLGRVNLTKVEGRQIEIDLRLVGIHAANDETVILRELMYVPENKQQLASAAIALQKVCPVSGKALGSMGVPIGVELDGNTLYVCCSGCVDAVKAEPARYRDGVHPRIVVSGSTAVDAQAISAQKVCPVMDEQLGGMGTPIKVLVGSKPIYLCCKGCIKKVEAAPAKYLAMVYGESPDSSVAGGTEQVREGIFKGTEEDKPFIAAQKKCPVMDEPLDAMGGPYKVHAGGKAIYICCPGCAKLIAEQPQKWLDKLAEQGVTPPTIRM